MRPVRVLAPALLLLLAGPPAAADTFVLRNGSTIDGYRAGTSPRGEVLIGTPSGIRRITERVLAEVRPSADPAGDYPRYRSGIREKDVDGIAWLGAWARERGLEEAAGKCFEEALALDPEHPVAREGLGFVKADGKWISGAEAEALRALEALREEIAEGYRVSMGTKPEVVLPGHWTYVDFTGGGKAAARAAEMEAAFAAAKEVLGEEPWTGRVPVLACSGEEGYHLWIDKEGGKLRGFRGAFVEAAKRATGLKWQEPPALVRSDLPDSHAMHAAHVHTAGHLLVNLWKVLNREAPFWIEEGFGGWVEHRVLATNTSYCWAVSAEDGYGSKFRGSKQWEVDAPDLKMLVRKAAQKEEFLPLDQLDALPRGQYSRREVGQSFSFVAFLLKEQEPARFRDYLTRVKNGVPSPVAFRQAYGRSFEEIDPEWRRFAAATGW